ANAVSLNVFVEDIFDNTAAAHASFQADDFAAAVVGSAVGNSDIADAPGGFAAEADEAGGVANVAIADDNVLGGAVDAEAVGVAAGLQANGVVIAFDVAAG